MDNSLINSVSSVDTSLIDTFAMKPITDKSLIIKNGVMYILGGVSSGKSTLIARLITLYERYINPFIICVYSGFAPDETTQLNLSNQIFINKPYKVGIILNV